MRFPVILALITVASAAMTEEFPEIPDACASTKNCTSLGDAYEDSVCADFIITLDDGATITTKQCASKF